MSAPDRDVSDEEQDQHSDPGQAGDDRDDERPATCRGELVTLEVMLPEKPDPELEKFVTEWRGTYSPRQAMEA